MELEIGSGSVPGEYAVRVLRAPAGGHAAGTFDLDVEGILNRLANLEATVLASAAFARRQTPLAERPVREVGQQLFKALFSREVYGTYRASLGAAQQSGRQLRLVLRLGAPQLAALPWEMLFDPETESYLCQTEPLLRHVPAPDYHVNPLEVVPPLRILGVVASPRGLPALDVEAEKEHLARALAGPAAAGRIELVWAQHSTWDDVHEQLLAGPWHVLHFIGHGDYDTATDEGQITLLRADGRADSIEASRFVDLLSTARPVPRLVVLNSCYSGRSGDQDLFAGTAAALVRGGINAVAAMQFTVSDVGAVAFAHGFYAALANGRSIDEATRNGRISMRGKSGGTLEWVTPVLYVRGGSTELFTLTGLPVPQPAAAAQPPARTDEPDLQMAETRVRDAQLRALYVQASAELRTKHYGPAIELLNHLLTLEPAYRDAAALRETARDRFTAARTYLRAREAEHEQDWMAAAAGYAQLAADPAYPDAAERKTRCESRQRISELEAELRYHADTGSWQAVLDVAAELEGLDPASADPDGLATTARAELLTTHTPTKPDPSDNGSRPPPHRRQPSGLASSLKRFWDAPPGPDKVPVTASAADVSANTPAALNAMLLLGGGVLLTGAGATVFWGGVLYRTLPLGLFLGLIVPAGYALVLLSGLPGGSRWSRITLSGAVLAAAAAGATVEYTAVQRSDGSSSSTSYAGDLAILSFVACLLAVTAGIISIRSKSLHRFLDWVLLAPLALMPFSELFFGGTLVPWGDFLLLVAAAGMTFIVAALRLKNRKKP
ncbi:CHAT domain-containing protein [[Micrococcus luteus] ATCC 49442]|uniref:CHAT domain-containing protein n=1 Tax=[Micrococcus luteus] ATCC 49442 TaxID=2698727 RepID=UPI0013D9ACAB|nr:CHAT domain-containing protein [[Micrococcus luteus] ATCC 49442]